jgi:hypothetical protein
MEGSHGRAQSLLITAWQELAREEGKGGRRGAGGRACGAARRQGHPGWLPAALLVREGRKERSVGWLLFA